MANNCCVFLFYSLVKMRFSCEMIVLKRLIWGLCRDEDSWPGGAGCEGLNSFVELMGLRKWADLVYLKSDHVSAEKSADCICLCKARYTDIQSQKAFLFSLLST